MVVVTLGSTFLLVPERARACSGNACTGLQLAPSAGSLPANLPGFFTRFGSYDAAETKSMELVRTDAAGKVEVGPDYKLKSKLVVGGSYQATLKVGATQTCLAKEVVASFVAGPEAALPTTLGDPVVVKQGHESTLVGFTNASCYSALPSAYVDLEPSLLPDATAWRGAVVGVRAVVDGKDYWVSSEEQPADKFYPTGGSGLKPMTGGDVLVRVFVACGPINSGEASSYVPLAEGQHTVKLRATLAGIGELESTETTIELRCPAAPPDAGAALPRLDGGARDGGSSSPAPFPALDASVGDTTSTGPTSTAPGVDAAQRDGSVRDAAASTAAERVDTNEDSGCHAGPRAHGGASALLVWLLAWLLSCSRSARPARLCLYAASLRQRVRLLSRDESRTPREE